MALASRPDISLPTWYDLVVAAGVDTPATRFITDVGDLTGLLDGETPAAFGPLVKQLTAFGHELGYPVFLRSGHTSGKHGYRRTCRVERPEQMASHVAAIVEYSAIADWVGLPTDDWVVRELLAVDAPFTAFDGLPIARERRYFVRDGVVVGHHPYWPPFTIEGASRPDWEPLLAEINRETDNEIAELTALTERVGRMLPGAWSVDWLWVPRRGWVCIDAAHGERSYCWDEHPNAPAAGWWRA